MSESLVDRIGFRMKFVSNPIDRRLLLEAREQLSAVVEPAVASVPGFVIPQEPTESRAEAFVRVTGVKLMPWQRKWLNEADL